MTLLGISVPRADEETIRQEFQVSLRLVRNTDDGSLDTALRRLWLAMAVDGVST